MKEIKIRCKGSILLSLSELKILQDTDDFQLKELSENNFNKLKNSIDKKGFWFPFFVWFCKDEKQWYYTDGTQRHKVLNWMQNSGEYKLPEKFPCVEIDAKDKNEAAQSILIQSSSFGKITDESLYGYIYEFNIELPVMKDIMDLPNFNIDDFEIGWTGDNNLDIIENSELVKSSTDHFYGANSRVLRIGNFMAYLTDENIISQLDKLTNGIMENNENQKKWNDIGHSISQIIIENENIFLSKKTE